MSERPLLNIVIEDKLQETPGIRYALTHISNWLGLKPNFALNPDPDGLNFYYGSDKSVEGFQITINASNFWDNGIFGKKGAPELPCLWESNEIILITCENELIVPYIGGTEPPYLRFNGKQLSTNLDFVASIFFFLSGYEQRIDPVSDESGRYDYRRSFAFRTCSLRRPLVNEYLEVLRYYLSKIDPSFSFPYPLGDKPVFFLSHDVDVIRKYCWKYLLRRIGADIFSLRFSDLIRLFTEFYRVKSGKIGDPFYCFSQLLEIERELHLESSFYFFGIDRPFSSNVCYGPDSLARLAHYLERNGREVGLHFSEQSIHSSKKLRAEKALLESTCKASVIGGRSHYLRFIIPETPRHLTQAGFSYDASVGCAQVPGFASSVCYPYKLYDVDRNCELPLWEIPLTVMDGTLKDYLALDPEQAKLQMDRLFLVCTRYRGVFSLLWHNSSLFDFRWQDYRDVYQQFLKKVAGSGIISQTGAGIIRLLESSQLASRL
ncbi:MAG: polysaccharide deacetylase family protein [Candidatus Wallbacteria bacterium]|nr:polysaccharide deacetylase family protein [Candidatus Wallbacteria bacterium]